MNSIQAYIGIGSNLGERKKHIKKAFCEIADFCDIDAYSKAYRTAPYGVLNQPDFINLVIRINTELSPHQLLDKLQEIEKKGDRTDTGKWRERTIDLDILFYQDQVTVSSNLVIPHPDIHNREFVLQPMMDIEPDFMHPTLKMTIRELYQQLKNRE